MSITLQLVLLLSPSDVLPGEGPSSSLLRMVSCTAAPPCVQRVRRRPDLAACARLGAGGRAASKHSVHKSIHGLSVKMFRAQTSPYYERPFGQRSREKSQALSEPTNPPPDPTLPPPPTHHPIRVTGGDRRDTNCSSYSHTQPRVVLPSEVVALLRELVLDADLAERRPSLRSRLRPFLARADPEGADLLQVPLWCCVRFVSLLMVHHASLHPP